MHFRFLEIPVIIQPTFWLFLLIFSFNPQIEPWQMVLLAAVLIFSLLFHEYGHALAAKKLGCMPEITLEGFGGYASYDARGVSEKQQACITLCGPLFTGLLIGLSFYFLKQRIFHTIYINYFLYYTMHLNTYWLIVNLSPLVPLDGGRLVEYLFKKWFGLDKGHHFSLIVGNITAVAGFLYFLCTENYLFTYFFLFHGWRNFQTYKAKCKKPNPFAQYNEARLALEESNFVKATSLLKKLSKSRDEYIQTLSLESMADLLDRQGKSKKAYKLLRKIDPQRLNRGKWLLCKLAFLEGDYEIIQQYATDIYHIQPTLETAMLNAKAFSHLKCHEDALGWLHTALQFEEAKERNDLLSDAAFDSLRNEPGFGQR